MISEQHLNFAKGVVKFVSGLGVAKIVHDIIDEHVITETAFDTLKVWAGAAVISSMVSSAASKHVDIKTDELVAHAKEFKEKYHETKKPNP